MKGPDLMRIPASAVGTTVGPREHEVDARWLMAYAAALGEHAPRVFRHHAARTASSRIRSSRSATSGPWRVERPGQGAARRGRGAQRARDARPHLASAAARGRPAQHHGHRAPRSSAGLPAPIVVTRMETVDAAGRPVSTTEYGSLYLGVECDVAALTPSLSPAGARATLARPGDGQGEGWSWTAEVPIARHPRPRLHGVRADLEPDPHRPRGRPGAPGCPTSFCTAPPRWRSPSPRRWARQPRGAATPVRADRPCRFRGMVRLPSRITVRGQAPRSGAGGRRGRVSRRSRPTAAPRVRDGGGHAGDVRTRDDQARARPGRAPARAHRSAALRLLAPLPGRGSQRRPRSPSPPCASTSATSSDFLKVTPTGGYAVADWGCVESDEVAARRPSAVRAPRGQCSRGLEEDPPGEDGVDRRGPRTSRPSSAAWWTGARTAPPLPTVFSPLSLARKLSGDRLNYDLKENPQAVTDALEAITETILAFMDACFREGAEGIFYSVQAASTAFHTEEEYRRFGEPYDRRILEAVRPQLQAHDPALPRRAPDVRSPRRPARRRLELGRSPRGPVAAGRAGPGARARSSAGSTSGTRSRTATPRGRPRAEARDALAQTDGRGVILGAGCVLPVGTSDATLVKIAQTLGGVPKLGFLRPQ